LLDLNGDLSQEGGLNWLLKTFFLKLKTPYNVIK